MFIPYILIRVCILFCFPDSSAVKNLPTNAGDTALGWEDPLEKEMATDSSILAWEIPWTEDPDGLQSMRLQKNRL